MVCVAVREVVGAAPAGLPAGGAGIGETITVLGAAGVGLAVTGQMVVYMAIVDVIVRTGQSLTVDGH